MSTQWYYIKNGQRQGPINSKMLRQLANSGEVKPEEYIWKAGMTEWKTAKQVKGLFSESDTPPPVQTSPEPDPPALSKAAKDLVVALTAQTKKTGNKAIQAANDWRQKRAEANPVEPPAPATPTPVARRPRRRRRRSKLVFIVGAIGLFIILFMYSGLFGPQGKLIRTPSIFGGSTTNYTVDEFRKKIEGKSFNPKSRFYDKYGKPLRVYDGYKHSYLYYRCKDGTAKITIMQVSFQRHDRIWVISIKQAR